MTNITINTSRLKPRQTKQEIQGYQLQTSQDLEDRAWDRFLVRTEGGHHVQTSLWAQVKASLGWDVLRLTVTRQGEIVAGAQILVRKLPLIGAIGYVPRGPLLAINDPLLIELVLKMLKRLAKSYRILYLVVQPPVENEVIEALPRLGFQPTTRNVAPTATVVIDLSQDKEEIRAQLRKKTRYGIRRARREGITIREGTEEDLDTLYDIMLVAAERRKYEAYPRSYFAEMWRLFHPHGYIKMLLAEYQGEAVSVHMVIPFGDTLLAKMGYWSGQHGQLRPNELLEWEMIKWAKEQGFRYYDFEGIDPKAAKALQQGEPLPEHLQQSPTSFKLGFSQQIVFFPEAYEYIYHPLMRWLYVRLYQRIANSKRLKRLVHRFRTR